MPTVQKAPHSVQARGLAPRRIHGERELCLKALPFSSLPQLHRYSSWGSRLQPQTRSAHTGEAAWLRLGVKFLGVFAPQETHHCTSKQADPLCGGVWQPFEPWTEAAGLALRLAQNQKTQCPPKKTSTGNVKEYSCIMFTNVNII